MYDAYTMIGYILFITLKICNVHFTFKSLTIVDINIVCAVIYVGVCSHLTLSNPIFFPPTYSPALIYFGRETGWWITCNYPTVFKEININRKSTTCAICWLKSVLHEEKRREQENHNVEGSPTL
jgi:hypothetical protein